MGRRIEKKVYFNNNLIRHVRFVYDGYLQIEELDALSGNTVTKRRVWGGEKIIADYHNQNGVFTAYYAFTDANKNITEYIDASGNIAGHYEYSPFGKITVSTGTMPSDFDFRFSSEYYDPETQLVYYNYRYYSPELGRWLSRDPIGEDGGWNLYETNLNNLINRIDLYGEFSWPTFVACMTGMSEWDARQIINGATNKIAKMFERIMRKTLKKKFIKKHGKDFLKTKAGKKLFRKVLKRMAMREAKAYAKKMGKKALMKMLLKEAISRGLKRLVPGIGKVLLIWDICEVAYCSYLAM